MVTIDEFRKLKSTKEREQDAQKLRTKYPDRVPVIACCDPRSRDLPAMDRHKFLSPMSITVGEMCFVIRKRMRLAPEQALFVFCEDGTLPNTSALLSDVYSVHRNHDNYLYLIYAAENTFGSADADVVHE